VYTHKTGKFFSYLFPSMYWQMKAEKTIFLTFDDGPIPDVTEFVLENLAQYDAKATFFCVGDNILKNTNIFQKVVRAGHIVANHTFHHLQGWKNDNLTYFENVELCQQTLEQALLFENYHQETRLFRPPHGLLKPSQLQYLKTKYKIIMWDVLTGDFDKSLTPEKCLTASLANTESGSIVTFHDSIKASRNMQYTLPRFLAHFAEKGYHFAALDDALFEPKHNFTVVPCAV